MTPQEALNICPDLKRISYQDINKISQRIFDQNIDMTKTFGEQGICELECIELLLEIEKEFDISIDDRVADVIFNENSKPNFFIQKWREDQINKILDE
jgi:acyl carrier protein